MLEHTFQAYESPANELLMPESWERVALVSITYNRGEPAVRNKMQDFYTAIQSGDRAEAWFQIRYNAQTANPLYVDGIAKRRFFESEIFGLYDNPGGVSKEEAYSVFRMFTMHRDAILNYEATYGQNADGTPGSHGNLVSKANADYGLSVVSYAAVDTLKQALTPAYEVLFADLKANYPVELSGLNADNFSPLNVYLDPNRDLGQSVVFLDDPNHSVNLDSSIDVVTGQEQNTRDLLIGEGGDDTLKGGKGSDLLIGGIGNDTLEGGKAW